jgi:hypothetical protein
MTDQSENQSASPKSDEGSARDAEPARSEREAFERLCEKIHSTMSGCGPWRPPEHCRPREYCPPQFGPHHHHYCGPPHHYGPPPYYYGPPPSLSLLNHLFQFAGARAHFWHRWFESLSGSTYRSQLPYWVDPRCYGPWQDPCCYPPWYDPCYHKHDPCCDKYDPCCDKYDPCCHKHDPCCDKHDPCCELPDCDEFKEMKGALKEFISSLDDDQRKKYEPVICEMIHCVAMVRRADAVRRRSYGHRRHASAGPGWN